MKQSRPLALLATLFPTLALALASALPAGAQPPPPPAPPFATPNTDACPFAAAPPPAIDLSEVPRPGQSAPAPLPRTSSAVGGPRLGNCGVSTATGAPPMPQGISAASWVVADLDTGQVVAAKDPHGRYRPASTLKLLTTAVVLNTLPLDEVLVGTQADADAEGSSVGVGPGGRYTVRELLLGLLLESGNDAAHALAARMGGDAATVAAMNSLAESLGAFDTRAVTPSGLDGPGMSSSAYDLALFFRHDIANPTFAQLTTTPSVLFPGYADKPPFLIANQDLLLTDYPGAIGGKNGFTNDARQTYVGAAQRGGRRLVVTLMAGERVPLTPERQATALLDYGFAQPTSADVGQLVPPGTGRPNIAASSTATTTGAPAPDATTVAAGASTSGAGSRWLIVLGASVVVLLCLLVVVRSVRRRR